jgi:hypothetical protein
MYEGLKNVFSRPRTCARGSKMFFQGLGQKQGVEKRFSVLAAKCGEGVVPVAAPGTKAECQKIGQWCPIF